MATTETIAMGDGTTTEFGFPFPYIKTEDVKVELQEYDATQTPGNQIISRQTITDFVIPSNNPTVVQFSSIGAATNYQAASGAPLANHAVSGLAIRVRIYRFTDADSIPATFIQGSAVRAQDLNDNFEQTLYIMQERQNTLLTIQTGGIGENVISTNALQDDAVDASKLRDSVADDSQRAVTTDHIRDNAVTTAKIVDNAVTTAKIVDGAVTTDKIVDDTVTTAKIVDDAVTTAKIVDNAVTTDKIVDNAVTTTKIVDDAVTTAKITDLNVTTGKLADNAVTSGKIADDTIVNADVNSAAAIDGSKINPNFGSQTITTTGNIDTASINSLTYPTAGTLNNRNLIINGAMNVAQRDTQVTGVTTSGYRTCDRWRFGVGTLGTWTVDQATDAPEGFTKSFKATCTTADPSPAAADALLLTQRIEAQNLQHLKYGTANAENLTVSFWVKSNKTGSASFDILQDDNSNRQFTTSYTINSANVWEYKTITIPGDPSGIINDDNGQGLQVNWWLNSGSGFTTGTHNATWEASAPTNRNATNLGVGGATSDYFAITGVQLELGDVATPFEHRSFNDELQRCLRYYEKNPTTQSLFRVYPGGSSVAVAYSYIWNVEKRAAPTTVTTGTKTPSGFAQTIDKYGVYYFRAGSPTAYRVDGPITADAEL